jgi:hypothetical protein
MITNMANPKADVLESLSKSIDRGVLARVSREGVSISCLSPYTNHCTTFPFLYISYVQSPSLSLGPISRPRLIHQLSYDFR